MFVFSKVVLKKLLVPFFSGHGVEHYNILNIKTEHSTLSHADKKQEALQMPRDHTAFQNMQYRT